MLAVHNPTVSVQMLEPRFTVEHLADILVIPASKTLLRRHLNAHFVNLVGQKTQAKKREIEQSSGMPLTLNMKVKTKRPNIFRRGEWFSVATVTELLNGFHPCPYIN